MTFAGSYWPPNMPTKWPQPPVGDCEPPIMAFQVSLTFFDLLKCIGEDLSVGQHYTNGLSDCVRSASNRVHRFLNGLRRFGDSTKRAPELRRMLKTDVLDVELDGELTKKLPDRGRPLLDTLLRQRLEVLRSPDAGRIG